MSDDLPFLDIAGRYPLLTTREEILLGRRIQAWLTHPEPVPPQVLRSGRRARDRFVLCNLRLVASIARYYIRRLDGTSLTYSDLLQEGVIGLQRATELYSPSCGYKMSTYASWWVRQSITRLLERSQGTIRITRTAHKKLTAYTLAEQEGGTPEQILARAGLGRRDHELVVGARECSVVLSTAAMRQRLDQHREQGAGEDFDLPAPAPEIPDPDLYLQICDVAGEDLVGALQRLEDGERVSAAEVQRLRARLLWPLLMLQLVNRLSLRLSAHSLCALLVERRQTDASTALPSNDRSTLRPDQALDDRSAA